MCLDFVQDIEINTFGSPMTWAILLDITEYNAKLDMIQVHRKVSEMLY